MQALLQQLDQFGRRILPFLVTLGLILVSVAAAPIPEFAAIKPLFALMAVYYWSVHRPDLLQFPALFVLGLILDVLARLPLGLSALDFILAAQLVRSQRHIFADQSYPTLWLGFAAVTLLLQALNWSAMSLFAWRLLPLWPLTLQTLLTLALFPFFAWLMILIQRYIVK